VQGCGGSLCDPWAEYAGRVCVERTNRFDSSASVPKGHTIRLGAITVETLGDVPQALSKYQEAEFTYLPGYQIVRAYWNETHTEIVPYRCFIENGPAFVVERDGVGLVRTSKAEGARPPEATMLTGQEFFGLNNPLIIQLIKARLDQSSQQSQEPISSHPPESAAGCARLEGLSLTFQQNWQHSSSRRDADNGKKQQQWSSSTAGLTAAARYLEMKRSAKCWEVRHSKIHCWGLFATETIPKAAVIIEYVGEILTSDQIADQREKLYEKLGKGCYMFRLDDDRIVDATMKGNAARFVNHSCEPNAFATTIVVEGERHIVLVANDAIQPGQELTYDYKFTLDEGHDKIACHCGAKWCRMFMN